MPTCRAGVETDLFDPTHASVTICPITSDCVDASLIRLNRPPGSRTGLENVSQVMVDKIVSFARGAISPEIGQCDAGELEAVDEGLRRWLALS